MMMMMMIMIHYKTAATGTTSTVTHKKHVFLQITELNVDWDSSVSKVTWFGLDGWVFDSQKWQKYFLFSIQTSSGAYRVSNPVGTGEASSPD
jgi:hypothetical protein